MIKLFQGIFAVCSQLVLTAYLTYDLIIIEDSETPLAPGAGHPNYYLLTVLAIIVISLLAVLMSWAYKRNTEVKRLKELNSKLGFSTKVPFRISSIKEEIATAEANLTASML